MDNLLMHSLTPLLNKWEITVGVPIYFLPSIRMFRKVVFTKDDSLISHGVRDICLALRKVLRKLRRTIWAPGLGLCSVKECV
jgi:hypothetical protein